MRQFYLQNKERISQTLSDQLPPARKSQTLSDQLARPGKNELSAPSVRFTLSWSHYVFLQSIKDQDERSFYEIEAAQQDWSLRELSRIGEEFRQDQLDQHDHQAQSLS
jgi:hypothetical protein